MSGPRTFGPGAASADARREILTTEGFNLPIIIRRPFDMPGHEGAPAHIEAAALIDTGASGICIDRRIAQELGLPLTGQVNMGVVGDYILANVYAGLVEVPELGFRKVMELLAPANKRVAPRVLLGRSFLADYVVSFDGPSGTFTFHNVREDIAGPIDDE